VPPSLLGPQPNATAAKVGFSNFLSPALSTAKRCIYDTPTTTTTDTSETMWVCSRRPWQKLFSTFTGVMWVSVSLQWKVFPPEASETLRVEILQAGPIASSIKALAEQSFHMHAVGAERRFIGRCGQPGAKYLV